MEKLDFNEVKLFINRLGYNLLDEIYKNNRQKLTIVDELGYFYYTNLFNLKDNIKHNTYPQKFSTKNPYSIYNLNLWCGLNNKPFMLINNQEYKGNDKKLKWKCLKDDCGEIFESTWANIESGWGCGYCAGRQIGLSNCLAIKRPDLAKQWHITLNGGLTPWDVGCGNHKEVWWQCDKGHEWQAKINNRNFKNSGCPYCSGRLPTKDYNLLVCNPELCLEWDYEKNNKLPEDYLPNSNDSVYWKCKNCGHGWFANIQNRNALKSGCPLCNISHGEKRIRDYFINKGIYYICQYKFSDCKNKLLLPFDFYIPSLNMCVEYQGIQHYEPIEHFGGELSLEQRKYNDEIKRNYCFNNINFIEIPYWDFNKIEEILDNYITELKEAS